MARIRSIVPRILFWILVAWGVVWGVIATVQGVRGERVWVPSKYGSTYVDPATRSGLITLGIHVVCDAGLAAVCYYMGYGGGRQD